MDNGTDSAGRVLVVEDDATIVTLLDELLTEEGYRVDVARDGQRGLHLALVRDYDVIILDRGLPALDGLDLLNRLRAKGDRTPVLVLSALGNPVDRVAGLDAGAEDYVTKPFHVEELLARLRALLRHHLDHARWLPINGARSVDVDARMVLADGVDRIQLSERECDLLAVLARAPQRVFSRIELLTLAFPDAESEVVVDTYVHYLRRKLGKSTIATIYGRGFQLGAP